MIKVLERHRRWLSSALFLLILGLVGAQSISVLRRVREDEYRRGKEKFWRSAMVDSDTAIAAVDADTGVIVEWSAGAAKLTGWRNEEVVGYGMEFMLPTEDYIARHKVIFRDRAIRERSLTGVFRIYGKLTLRSGQLQPVLLTVRGFQNGHYLFIATMDPVDRVVEVNEAVPTGGTAAPARAPSDFGPRQVLPDDYWIRGK